MRIAIPVLVLVGVAWLAAAPADAAPVPLSGTAAHTIAKSSGSAAITVAKRTQKRVVRCSPRSRNWQCKRYWRPYQYRYWKFYYPYGGPLFTSRR